MSGIGDWMREWIGWRARTGWQRATFVWAALAVVVVLVRFARAERRPYVADWRRVGVTPAGDTLDVDVAGRDVYRDAFGVRLRPATDAPPTGEPAELTVSIDCAGRRVTMGRVHRRAAALTAAAVTTACASVPSAP